MKILKTIFGSILILSFLRHILFETKKSNIDNLAMVISLILGVLIIKLSYSKNILAIKTSNAISIIIVILFAVVIIDALLNL